MESMDATTLHQPWASLVAAEVKHIETRSWRPYRRCLFNRMAIHAGRKKMKRYPQKHMQVLTDRYGPLWKMPFGAVVAVATLMTVAQVVGHSEAGELLYVVEDGREPPGGIWEDPWGDFSVGRYLWVFGDIRELDEPVPVIGRQGIWQWTPPVGWQMPKGA